MPRKARSPWKELAPGSTRHRKQEIHTTVDMCQAEGQWTGPEAHAGQAGVEREIPIHVLWKKTTRDGQG